MIGSMPEPMSKTVKPDITTFGRDMTLRWQCRKGDFLLWLGYRDLLSGPEGMECHDLWEMGDGYHVTITNRIEDLPPWFRLHPSETRDSFVFELYERVKRGDYPRAPLDGPNLWRLRCGDRVAWAGAGRPERRSADGIIGIVDCCECALLIGEVDRGGPERYAGFGCPSTPEMKPADLKMCRAAVEAVKGMGLPRTYGREWRLG